MVWHGYPGTGLQIRIEKQFTYIKLLPPPRERTDNISWNSRLKISNVQPSLQSAGFRKNNFKYKKKSFKIQLAHKNITDGVLNVLYSSRNILNVSVFAVCPWWVNREIDIYQTNLLISRNSSVCGFCNWRKTLWANEKSLREKNWTEWLRT